jgi:tRNA pseudouridine55 synthase
MSCSSGTYVRSFIHELGQLLGCGALMSQLRRIRVSRWKGEQSKLPEEIVPNDALSSETIIREYIDFSKTSEGEKDWLLRQMH